MAWTYLGTLATTRDWVRFLVGDTETNRQLLTDAEIDGIVAEEPNRYLAASTAAEALAAKYTRIEDGSLSVEFRQLSRRLRVRGRQFGIVPYAGGISDSDIESVTEDTDRPTPHFRAGMHDNVGVSYDPE